MKGFKWGRGQGEGKGTLLISPSHAPDLASEFLSPSLSKACHSYYLFFLIIYDVDVICLPCSVVPPYYRTRRNKSKYA